ncbi:indolepyruvate oxidoreductase subunit beta [Parasporobacterium paucivorans]|uniref:Indolepyruvate ferredoxin oxidoreductase beta subunit n=1 Tax=Parasporobacterium paucivorans DSM 15970 TaxID=1122934 RepID=A0A1M6DNA0_9FIRM|nr:indolepyruvate oxidoreductase subunit beta [Parasporobacterium paucivorans]SHI74599.1 indolepyruvate ferredoxin oxidoreductase beta subunit [Parasporobacterium paucivorans DSM 15970]
MMTKNIMIVGVGGQGTLLTSRILGGITLKAGYDVKLSEVHGMAQRGGSVVTFVRYGEKVYEPIVEEGQADVLIAFERLEALRYAHYLKKDGVIILNDQRIDPITVVTGAREYPEGIVETLKKKYKVLAADALEESKKLGNTKVFNIIILGLAARFMDFKKEDWLQVIEEMVPKKTVEINKKAFETGYSGLQL